jgi:hypothetical protein
MRVVMIAAVLAVGRLRAATIRDAPHRAVSILADEESAVMPPPRGRGAPRQRSHAHVVMDEDATSLPIARPRTRTDSGNHRAPVAIPKTGQCPSNWMQSGNYCIDTRRR